MNTNNDTEVDRYEKISKMFEKVWDSIKSLEDNGGEK